MNQKIIITFVGLALAATAAFFWLKPRAPERPPARTMIEREQYRFAEMVDPDRVIRYVIEHDPDGLYMARGPVSVCEDRPGMVFDAEGIPAHFSRYDGIVYHPGGIQLCAFSLLYAIQRGHEEYKDDFLVHMEKLLELQDEDGALRHHFRWTHTIFDFPAGWVSGLNQGKQLSLNVRAYHMTGDERYLESGKRALEFMLKPIEEGGTLSTLYFVNPEWRDHVFIEEFPAYPPTHVLNGGISAMIGLYDWAYAAIPQEYGSELARKYFDRTVESLKLLLPFYDVEIMSTGDLRHVTREGLEPFGTAHYHLLHSRQMNVMHMLTGDPIFKEYEQKWISDFARVK